MTPDPSIIAALSAAVQADAENIPLRLHLAGLLIAAGRPAEALEQCASVLGRQPDHLEALRVAAEAADAVGDRPRAEGYRRLYTALGGSAPPPGDAPFPPAGRAAVPPPSLPDLSASPFPELDSDIPFSGEPPPDESDRVKLRQGRGDGDKDDTMWEAEKPDITLADVAGMDEVKRRLNVAFLAPMKNPEMRKMYGKSLRGGLLLYGPPGCGKTFIARATAGELGARFVSVGLSDVLDMYLGQSERNLHEIFETARRNRPCVLFFDEIDALGRKRSLMRESAGRDVVNQLLAEMDTVGADNEGVFVLAATNHPWDVDTALRRPGRLDRTLLVLPPDAPAREAMLRYHSRERPLENIDWNWLAGRTEHYSGADLAHLCESAAETAMEESLQRGRARPIGMNDFKKALKEIRPSVRPWFDTARNYALFANEGGVYDDLLNYLRAQRLL
uniref:Cell division protein FtsH n=1 Tax=uncultured Armatimonadetes bacterium TaxID=157466 RepID=A0A6J4K2L0_9BACT|nr:Cell division protein FtsH [uncultured Armatimonadetes bacterium]